MNRILLIGNGFDVAHGMKTKYSDFIKWFWKKQEDDFNIKGTSKNGRWAFNKDNAFFNFKVFPHLHVFPAVPLQDNWLQECMKHKKIIFRNKFLEIITKIYIENWVDIEEEYNKQLHKIGLPNEKYKDVDELNKDFLMIKNELEGYLSRQSTEREEDEITHRLLDIIYSKFDLQDFIPIGTNDIIREQYKKINELLNGYEELSLRDISETTWQLLPGLKTLYNPITKEDIAKILHKKEKVISNDSFQLYPKHILFLNFNYTNTEKSYHDHDFYRGKKEGYKNEIKLEKEVIHIHGELNNKKNPIIFGYGDEIADQYKILEEKNDNRYLENTKSIKYLETGNYKQLLKFIDSDKYQVFVLGHSCGISDRTLLNKLFEHENCVSIKVFGSR